MATKINQYNPQTVSHAGGTLAEKLSEMGMTIKEFAVRTSKPEKTIIAVIKGESSITPDMAVAFENVTRIPTHFWMRRQQLYDEYLAKRRKNDLLQSYAEWTRNFPVTAMAKQCWIQTCKTATEKTEALLAFFAVNSPKAWANYYMHQQLKVAFRISLASTKEPYAISAWLRQGELQASKIQTDMEYTEKKLRETIPVMKAIMSAHEENVAEQLQDTCKSCGIKLVYTPCLPKAPISGSTRWLNDTPCIQLSGRQNRYDIFWFSFFHEVGHILLHGKKDIFLESIDYDDKQKEKEAEADNFASKTLLTQAEEDEIVKNGDFSEDAIRMYAKKFSTHPSVIVGRLQHKKHIGYWQDNQLVEKIDLFKE